MLSVSNVCMRFKGLTALDKVSLAVEANQIHALIGPNGAGKTTLFNIISGVQRPSEGTVSLEGVGDLASVPLANRARVGIMRTFQNIRLFGSMTVLENVLMGSSRFDRSGTISTALGLPGARAME